MLTPRTARIHLMKAAVDVDYTCWWKPVRPPDRRGGLRGVKVGLVNPSERARAIDILQGLDDVGIGSIEAPPAQPAVLFVGFDQQVRPS